MARNTYMAIFGSLAEAAAALEQLRDAGFDISRVSFAGMDSKPEGHTTGGDMGDGIGISEEYGLLWTKFPSPINNWRIFKSSGNELLLVMGSFVQAVVSGRISNGGASGVSDFAAGLAAIGIPSDSIVHYEHSLARNQFVLMLDGAVDEIARAYDTLADTEHINGTLHHGADSVVRPQHQ